MNWYYAAGFVLICLTAAIPIWAVSRVERDLEAVPAVLRMPEHLDG